MDEQHKALIGLMQSYYTAHLNRNMQQARQELAQLLTLTIKHFRTEESLMEKTHYPDLTNHKKEHEELLKTVEKLAQDYLQSSSNETAAKLANFLKTWLTRHILGSDKQYQPYLADI